MSKAKVFIIFALLGGSILLLSCSTTDNDNGGSSSSRGSPSSSSLSSSAASPEYAFCVYPDIQACYPGSYTSCPSGGELNNSCPYSSSGSEGASSSSEAGISSSDGGASSSSEGGTSSSEAGASSSGGASSSSGGVASSSSAALSSSSVGASYSYCVFETDKSCLNGPAFSCPPGGELSNVCPWGSFTDSRDSKEYKTVVIGTQTWMAENLNFKPSPVSGRLDRCYAEGGGQDDWLKPGDAKIEQNCKKYGRLYDWATATASVCPQGWHLPSRDEWNKLKDYVFDILWNNYEDEDFGWDVATKLKATSGWKAYDELGCGNGVDTYGFKAIGGGYCFSCDKLTSAEGSYSGIGSRGDGDSETARWWSATEHATNKANAYRFEMTYSSNVLTERSEYKSDLYSVRCVKN